MPRKAIGQALFWSIFPFPVHLPKNFIKDFKQALKESRLLENWPEQGSSQFCFFILL
jgi:hypothetical protein